MVLPVLSGCGPTYSPDTYASNAAQQANKAEQGIVVGVREVSISAAGTVGTVTGAAAGGIAGSEAPVGPMSAFTALGGTVLGGLAGNATEHVVSDTKAFEYIVRKPNGDLVSVTQKDTVPLALGQKVLVIAGSQARVVPDYTVAVQQPASVGPGASPTAKPSDASGGKPVGPAVAKTAEPLTDRAAGTSAAKPADVPADNAPVAKAADPQLAKPAASPSSVAGDKSAKPQAADIVPAPALVNAVNPAPTSP
jgi:outer membrane lipoprotein SlyB